MPPATMPRTFPGVPVVQLLQPVIVLGFSREMFVHGVYQQALQGDAETSLNDVATAEQQRTELANVDFDAAYFNAYTRTGGITDFAANADITLTADSNYTIMERAGPYVGVVRSHEVGRFSTRVRVILKAATTNIITVTRSTKPDIQL